MYGPREMEAVRTADCLVYRVRVDGAWRETAVPLAEGQTLVQAVQDAQILLRHDPQYARVCLYAGGRSTTGERMLASIPRDRVPAELHEWRAA